MTFQLDHEESEIYESIEDYGRIEAENEEEDDDDDINTEITSNSLKLGGISQDPYYSLIM